MPSGWGRSATGRRPRWWGELLVAGFLFWAYDEVRELAPTRRALADSNAHALMSVQRWLHVDVEHAVNSWLAGAPHALRAVTNYYYGSLHFTLPLILLLWMYWRHPAVYRRWRTVLVLVNVLAFGVFWLLPLTPPRLLAGGGFVDTIVRDHTWFSWGGSAADATANNLAAMPSLHEAWALWCALVIGAVCTRRWLRVLGRCYPVATAVDVVATGNHYVLDTLAGAVTVVVAIGVVALAARLAAPRLAGRLGPPRLRALRWRPAASARRPSLHRPPATGGWAERPGEAAGP